MISAQEAAEFFLHPWIEEDGEAITNLKLQKLLYYAQGYALAILKRPLFADKIENWQHGPVVPSVYHAFKKYGAGNLPSSNISEDQYSEEDLYIMTLVRKEKGGYTAWKLRDKTHQEPPWLNTSSGDEISNEAMQEYFSSAIPTTEFDFDLERMQKAMNSGFVSVPDFDNEEDLLNWLNQ